MKTTALLTMLLIGCMAATAQATTTAIPAQVRHEVVNYADLDLQTEAGATKLRQRIKAAARRVCGLNDFGMLPLELRTRLGNCASTATARALADVETRSVVVAGVY